jgi:hypothetical protein
LDEPSRQATDYFLEPLALALSSLLLALTLALLGCRILLVLL